MKQASFHLVAMKSTKHVLRDLYNCKVIKKLPSKEAASTKTDSGEKLVVADIFYQFLSMNWGFGVLGFWGFGVGH